MSLKMEVAFLESKLVVVALFLPLLLADLTMGQNNDFHNMGYWNGEGFGRGHHGGGDTQFHTQIVHPMPYPFFGGGKSGGVEDDGVRAKYHFLSQMDKGHDFASVGPRYKKQLPTMGGFEYSSPYSSFVKSHHQQRPNYPNKVGYQNALPSPPFIPHPSHPQYHHYQPDHNPQSYNYPKYQHQHQHHGPPPPRDHIHREHIHVHNIHKHNVHHHNVVKEHIHQPVYHKSQKHQFSQSEGHKNKFNIKEYNKHTKPVTQEVHRWVKPIYIADHGEDYHHHPHSDSPSPSSFKRNKRKN